MFKKGNKLQFFAKNSNFLFPKSFNLTVQNLELCINIELIATFRTRNLVFQTVFDFSKNKSGRKKIFSKFKDADFIHNRITYEKFK